MNFEDTFGFSADIEEVAKTLFAPAIYTEDFLDGLVDEVEDMIQNRGLTTYNKGLNLENLLTRLFSWNGMADVSNRNHTSTNEIDLVVKWKPVTKTIIQTYYPDLSNKNFWVEAKNYGSPVSVTWVAKFGNVLKMAGTNMGVLASLKGFSGRNDYSDAKGFQKKVALKDDIAILDFALPAILQRLKEQESPTMFKLLETMEYEVRSDIRELNEAYAANQPGFIVSKIN